ncbi:hypothetical protein ABTZ03_12850 [Kitasatospora sp. NPDC096077]|uniref:hypothetical protein n=1 Tax=Kitasatospora sp. NPDC096077 TaxID=3155544 RepID=UPI00331D8A5A
MPPRTPLAEWNPGLDDTITLRAAHQAMPGDDASAIPWYVRLLENPASPVALPGAVDLYGHDSIHILLGRGTLPPDEAFVIGVTMGASGTLRGWQEDLYTLAAQHCYRGGFRFSRTDIQVFRAAVRFARATRIRPLHVLPWRDLADRRLGELRALAGVTASALLAAYERERVRCPTSRAAQRLPLHQSPAAVPETDR